MPAGVSWGQYLKFATAAMISMLAGSQIVHNFYNPLRDLDYYIQREIETQHLVNVFDSKNDNKT